MQTQARALPSGPNNAKLLSSMWPAFVGLDKRRAKETPFILQNVPKPDPDVFDSCLGCGATTIGLRLAGVEKVISNEIDPHMQAVALAEAEKRGLGLDIVSYDWRGLPSSFKGRFDLVTCLGNSLTLLFGHDEQLKALRGFASVLSPRGVLIMDERNYPRILDGDFSQSGNFVYCGRGVSCLPYSVSEERVVMEYFLLAGGEPAYLELYPFKKGEMQGLISEAGFRDIRVFGDYRPDFDPARVEFFTYVARK